MNQYTWSSAPASDKSYPGTMFIFRRKHYPFSYIQNSNKERLLLWYTDNFRQQYHFVYKDRKPLFLAAENECGLQVTHTCPCHLTEINDTLINCT